MPDANNILPFRPRTALTSCTLPQDDDEFSGETPEEGKELQSIGSRPWSIDVFDGPGGKSLIDACLPTHIAVAAMAFIMERLEAPATV